MSRYLQHKLLQCLFSSFRNKSKLGVLLILGSLDKEKPPPGHSGEVREGCARVTPSCRDTCARFSSVALKSLARSPHPFLRGTGVQLRLCDRAFF